MANDLLAPTFYGGILLPRRGSAASWTAANPVLAAGEIGVEMDTGKFKIGDGASPWTGVSYAGGVGSGASGLPPAEAGYTTAEFPNYEVGGDATVTAVVTPDGAHVIFAMAKESDVAPRLIVTNVGDWVMSDGTVDPTNLPVGWIGLQKIANGVGIRGGGDARVNVTPTHVDLQGAITSQDDDMTFLVGGMGVVLTTPDFAHTYRISVDNSGAIISTQVT